MITFETELAKIRGLSPTFLKKLASLKIFTVRDLLWHFPFRYDDYSKAVNIADLVLNQAATVSGIIKKVDLRRTWKKKMTVVEAIVSDETGGIKAVWFNQPYIARVLVPGKRVNLAGKVTATGGDVYLSNPEYEFVSRFREARHTAGLIPVYPETKGLTSRGLRYLIKPVLQVLPLLPDFLPKEILRKNNLPDLNSALRRIHFPESLVAADQARKRFSFEDLFLLQLNNLKLKLKLAKEQAPALKYKTNELQELLGSLPFELTGSQKRSLDEILRDLSEAKPMNRLLQGDVGSGKTVVAAIGAVLTAKCGTQAAFMVPTEVLARQHYATLERIFGPLMKKKKIETALLLSDISEKEKKDVVGKILGGNIKIAVGTHALIQQKVKFKNLGLAIVDEQHRFGVNQRAQLVSNRSSKKEFMPHLLSMSATPIPRTLSLTIFGDLDVSIIDELPRGRKEIVTKVVSPDDRSKAYDFVRGEIKKGRQAFVVCPRIELANKHESGTNNTNKYGISEIRVSIRDYLWDNVKAVTAEYERLAKTVFPDLKISMIHGKMKSSEKEKIMAEFKAGESDILVSTSVIEVGVDVPNATVMIIEGAELFGLAQLYQFRGRIGRGEYQSYCLLFTGENGGGRERLNALLKAKNGFELAETDLKLRGPGEFLGESQTGFPDLMMKALSDMELVRASRTSAEEILKKDAELANFPLLKEKSEAFKRSVHLE